MSTSASTEEVISKLKELKEKNFSRASTGSEINQTQSYEKQQQF